MHNDVPENADLDALGELIEGIEVAMLTTLAADGSLVSRPLQTLELDADGDLVFFTSVESGKVDELAANPDVNVAYADVDANRYVSIRGRARIDRDRATIDELWSPAQKVFFPEGKGDPRLAVLRVRVRDAAWWDAAGNFVERWFDFARALMSEKPSDLGEHGRSRV
jgi:general stress protein 26